ncbi:DUF7383 domain-containing protein [Halorarius halobius]|uniref:DUF7383 domain-containing protein n=1 Tax=Halorarius halobius TaxID=2962671 RepID=UPI0020CF2A25|nr:hypothetical protein [Halorarius halobius]
MARHRANYALLPVLEHLGPDSGSLDVPWATFVGDRSSRLTFSVPTADPTDAYLELQAYDVDTYGHEIHVNGTALSGFDVPPGDGWQLWLDAVTDADLHAGENEVRVHRDTASEDAFAVGNVVVHWREPVE